MTTTGEAMGLGPFAPEQGPRSAAAVAAVATGATAVAAASLRVALDRAAPGTSHRGLGTLALALAVLGMGSALVGLFAVATRGRRGRGLVGAGLALNVAGGLAAFLYGAAHDGSLRPGRFADAYLDVALMRLIAGDLARGMINTIKLAGVSEVLAIVVGLVVATFYLSIRRWLHAPAVTYVDVVRGLPLIVLTSLIFGGLPKLGVTLDPFVAAVLALTINASAYIAEIFRAGIQSLARGQMDAARSLGMPYGTGMLYVVIPQAVRAVIPPLMSEFIALVKDTAIVLAIIGFTVRSADLFGSARTAAASTFSPTPYIAAAIGYLIITVPLARLVGRLEKRLRAGLA